MDNKYADSNKVTYSYTDWVQYSVGFSATPAIAWDINWALFRLHEMPLRTVEQYKMFVTFVLPEFYLPTESDTEKPVRWAGFPTWSTWRVPDYWVEPHTLGFPGTD